jgi:7-cyano-7-deazaguanine synthase in queuosine biosynthesis
MKEYAFICGGANAPDLASADQILRMDVAGPDRNVNLRLTDANRALVSDLPDLLIDLLELAAYVYCADQRASRGTEKLSMAGEAWRRKLRFVVPVRCRDIWESAAVREQLEAMLGYLSDDVYLLEFVDSSAPAEQVQSYFEFTESGGGFQADDVVLFSGGLDSLTGAVESLVGGRRLVLVGHHSAPKVVNVQTELVAELRQKGFGSQLFHVTVNVTNTGVRPVEPTQRTRSFLFASLAFVLARMFGRDSFTFYENGVVSFNLPISGDVLGARATRTTHPKVIRGFERFFSELVDREVSIKTPFLWLTRKEVIERLELTGHISLLAKSVSCVHPISWTTEVRHCGTCSQCIDRRFAVLAAGVEYHDVQDGYRVDLLTGDRGYEDVDPCVAYVTFARTIARLQRGQFQQEFPQVSAALHSVPGLSAREVLDRIWDLHHRHAHGILAVISDATGRNADDLAYGKLSPGSLLSLSVTRGSVQLVGPDTTATTAAFMDRLSVPTCEFAVDEVGKQICFKGGFVIVGANYRLIRELLGRHRDAKSRAAEVPYYWTDDLALALGVHEPTLRRQVGRLRDEAEGRIAVDHGVVFPKGFVENRKAKGYRLSPDLREVALADILSDVTNRTDDVTNRTDGGHVA